MLPVALAAAPPRPDAVPAVKYAMNAGRDVHARQATVDAGQGLLSVDAGRDIHIESGQAQTSGSYSMQWTDRSLVSRTANTLSGQHDSSTRVGSRFEGGLVALGAKNDIGIEGSHISGTRGVMLDAGRLLNIVEGRNTSSASVDFDRKRSSPIKDPVFMQNRASGTGIDVKTDTAAASTLASSQGGVLLRGGAVNLQAVQVSAARDIAIEGGTVNIAGAIDHSQVGGEQRGRGGDFGALGLHDLGHGLGAKSTDTLVAETTTLARTTLSGANVSISATGPDGQGGDLRIAGTTIDTPGTLSLNAGTLHLDPRAPWPRWRPATSARTSRGSSRHRAAAATRPRTTTSSTRAPWRSTPTGCRPGWARGTASTSSPGSRAWAGSSSSTTIQNSAARSTGPGSRRRTGTGTTSSRASRPRAQPSRRWR